MKGDAAAAGGNAAGGPAGGDGASAPGETGPIGPFGSWGALYATVVAWAALWVLFLYVLTLTLNVTSSGVGP